MTTLLRTLRTLLAGGLALAAVTGCSGPVAVDAAPGAADPLCADVVAGAPEVLAGAERRETTAQAAVAWSRGDQAPPLVLRCGVEPPGPTSEVCLGVAGPDGTRVDWVEGDDGATLTWTTYGRVPAVEVALPATLVETDAALTSTVLVELGDAVAELDQTRECLGAEVR